ncbi:hypothetical protein D3C83_213360 [compost metagenome]
MPIPSAATDHALELLAEPPSVGGSGQSIPARQPDLTVVGGAEGGQEQRDQQEDR